MCCRGKVQAALEWLIRYSPAYRNVTIIMVNLNLLPVNGNITTNVVTMPPDSNDVAEDLGPAPEQNSHQRNDSDFIEEEVDGSVNGPEGSAAGALDQIIQTLRGQIRQRTGVTTNASEEETKGEEETLPIPVFRQRFTRSIISWSGDVFFFTCCWPTLFMPCTFITASGSVFKDIPAGFKRLKSRVHTYTFTEWITYLMNCSDGRYAAHPTFKFAALNIKNRESCLSSTNYGVNQMPDEEW